MPRGGPGRRGDLPLLGNLFRSKSRSKAKTNLMVFIRPTIIRSAADARRITAQRYGTIRNDQLRVRPLEEPSIDVLVRDYLGTVPPIAEESRPGDVRYGPAPPPPLPAPVRG